MSAATAAVAKKAAAEKAPVQGLTKAQLSKGTEMREAGVTYAEIAKELGVPTPSVSLALSGVTRGGTKKESAPAEPYQRDHTSSLEWPSFVAKIKGLETGHVRWEAGNHCIVRADMRRGGVAPGVVLAATGTPWVTVCPHGAYKGFPKGQPASLAGREGNKFCPKCVKGEPGLVPLRPKAEGDPKPTKATKAPEVPAEKAALLAAARKGGAAAVKKATAKKDPKTAAAKIDKVAAAVNALARREAKQAADAIPAGDPLSDIA